MSEAAAMLDQPQPATPAEQPAAPQERTIERPVVEEPQVVTAQTPRRGKTLHNQGSYLSAVGSARFTTEHKLIFGQVKQALDLYQAEHGEYPRSHDEFMAKIIEPNGIVLPELDEGYEYWYDPSERSTAEMLKFRPIQNETGE
jgi:hypothetical protein